VYRLGMEHGSIIARGAAQLASRFPQRWDGATGDAISAECRAAGVPSVNVHSRGGHGKGCHCGNVETTAGAR
jgi:hypothetical protein